MIFNNQFIESFILSGAIGMVQYWVLREFEVLNFFNHKNTDEKASLVIILTFIHFIINNLIMRITEGSLGSLLTFTVSFIVSLFLSWCSLKILSWVLIYSHEQKLINRKPFNTYIPIFQDMIEDDIKEMDNYIVIFNLNNEIIEHGYLCDYSIDDNDIILNLKLLSWEGAETDFLKFRTQLQDKSKVYISAKNNMKIYIFKASRE